MRRLHASTTVAIHFGPGGEKKRPIASTVGVGQACILAPFLFLIYTNGLESFLLEQQLDFPSIEGKWIPFLSYADDAVLMTLTANSLQKCLNAFTEFMMALDLKVNFSK